MCLLESARIVKTTMLVNILILKEGYTSNMTMYTNMWRCFQQRYPNADFSKFREEKFLCKENVMF